MTDYDEALRKQVQEFTNELVEKWDRVFVRFLVNKTYLETKFSYTSNRILKNIKLESEHLSSANKIWETFNKSLEKNSSNQKSKPCVVVLDLHSDGNGSGMRFEYKDEDAYSIDQYDYEKCYIYKLNNAILPEEIRKKNRQKFASGKHISSQWRLEHVSSEEGHLKIWQIIFDLVFGKIGLSFKSWWLKGLPSKKALGQKKPATGLLLTFFEDGSFYDEASDPSIDLRWINEDGVIEPYHTTLFGKRSLLKDTDYLIPMEPSDIGPPAPRESTFVRYDDGDTKVVDSIRIKRGKLTRSVAIVTDDIYLNREVYIYKEI